jgi:transposase
LPRHGLVYCSGLAWTGRHEAWLRGQHLPAAAARLAFDSDYDAVLTVAARRLRLDEAIEAMAADSEFTPVVHRLGCLRGVSTLTAFALARRYETAGTWHPRGPAAMPGTGACTRGGSRSTSEAHGTWSLTSRSHAS